MNENMNENIQGYMNANIKGYTDANMNEDSQKICKQQTMQTK